MKPSILYVDNHLLAVNKPAGWLTQPNGTSQNSLECWAKSWIKENYLKTSNVFLEAVHRLDKPVSGVVLFGRTSKALSRLNSFQREKKSRKTYWAIVEGLSPMMQQGLLEHYLIHDNFKAEVVTEENSKASLACLKYKVLKRLQDKMWLEIELITGRYHQIRVQCSHQGFPIVGDSKYGSTLSSYSEESILLHHRELIISHPTLDKLMILNAPLPESWPLREIWEDSLRQTE